MKAQAHELQSHTLSLSSDLLTGAEWSAAQVQELFRLAADVKAHPDRYKSALAGRFLAMIFEKPSLRTRVTFEVGIASMGGTAVFLDHADTHLGERESIPDVARNLSRWVQGIVARVFSSSEALEVLAAHAQHSGDQRALGSVSIPARRMRFLHAARRNSASVRGLKLAYVGDGNNVCHSLMVAGARVGAHVRIATPAGYEPDAEIVAAARRDARSHAAARSNCFARPKKPSRARKPSTPTSGPAWARRARPTRAPQYSRRIRSTPS